MTTMDQRLVPSLKLLRSEFDTLAPHRDRGADGDVGDKAHQHEVSSHNPDDTPGLRTPGSDPDHTPEIHALDIDATGPWPAGKDLNWAVEVIRGRHLRGFDNRLQNVIWRGRVASRSWDWTWEDRPGIGHFDHAHFETTYEDAAEAGVRPWGLLETIDGRLMIMEKLEGFGLPILHQGDDDDHIPGYNHVSRVQSILSWLNKYNGKIDGAYGPQTASALHALGVNDGKSITLEVWHVLYGLNRL